MSTFTNVDSAIQWLHRHCHEITSHLSPHQTEDVVCRKYVFHTQLGHCEHILNVADAEQVKKGFVAAANYLAGLEP